MKTVTYSDSEMFDSIHNRFISKNNFVILKRSKYVYD